MTEPSNAVVDCVEVIIITADDADWLAQFTGDSLRIA